MMVSIAKTRQRGFMTLMPTAKVVLAKAKTPTQQRNELLAIADRYESRIKRKFIEALDKIKEQSKLKELAALIESGANEQQLFAALGIDSVEANLAAVTDEIRAAYDDGAVLTMQQAAAGVSGAPKILVRYDGQSQRVIDYLRNRSSELIVRLSEDARRNVRAALADGVGAGSTPTKIARHLRTAVGLSPRDERALRNYRSFLQDGDRRALARNIGGNAERIIEAAIRNDTMDAAKIERLVENYSSRLIARRAQTIAQTESFRAANAGALESWRQVAETTDIPRQALRRFWVATNDSHTRDAHLEIVLMNEDGVGLDEPFQSPLGEIMFPGDPNSAPENSINCRCTTVVRMVDVPEAALPPVVVGRSYLPNAAGFVDQTRRAR